ncbi:DUF4870 domain-containing protein [Demequina activiva]|uniref:Membrane protein n=1 Tax=Demequina activiva TaxID=1582364 RepID=A0A919UKY0_9MICO|nr:DUF4870 domain-containing protein [Demequina activiva]GIG55480.1 membrane protein [Demequina activiva]
MTDDNTTPPPEQPAAGQPAAAQPVSESDERTMGLLTHLSAILIGFIGPLIFWLIYRERSAFLNDQGKEALNFNITVAIAYVVAWILTTVTLGILFFLPFLVWIVALIFQIMGGIAANKHENYRYPFAIRLVK